MLEKLTKKNQRIMTSGISWDVEPAGWGRGAGVRASVWDPVEEG